ncbi:MAG: 1-acyl-sn-glycerol-3-phosphate acyltransferase [Actinomycetota bacterium]|nr:1-acyl-sn-glycerol-3-phosphate acyltransferase [Actinomycetota bacterium]
MKVPPRLVRRLVIDPLWVPLAIVLWLLLLATAIVAAVLAPLTRKRRILRAALLACVYLYLDLGLMLGSAWLWLRHPLPSRDERAWRSQHSELLGRALIRLMTAAHALFGYEVQWVGTEPIISKDRPLLVLARHAGPGDSFTLVHLLANRFDRNPRVILKQALQWDPGLDLVLTRLKCHFLPSRSGAGEDRVAAVAELSGRLDADDALLLFPEGGNWTPRRHRRSVVRLLKSGRRRQAARVRARTHVLPPRPGGTVAALAARHDTDVLVVAHAGLDTLVNPKQMWQALPLDARPMRIRAWLHEAETVPREEQGIRTWLTTQWDLIDQWVETEKRHD